jgi:fucose 4-O-acetylase-like acetyltransferase
MIREAAVKLTRSLYRPLHGPGPRSARKSAGSARRVARQPTRYPVLDNARFVLIALVVTGHLLEQLADQGPIATALYRWIYLFHMPAFVLISGAVSKSTLTRHRVFALATGLLLPYLIFQTLYPAWDAWLFHTGDGSQDYLTPYWLLWYLPSLACWRLLLPMFARLKFALPLAVAIALAAGLAPWIGYPLSLSRTLVFFPLFLLGHRLGGQRLQQLGDSVVRKGVALVVLIAAAFGAWLLRDLDPQWLYASVGYDALDIAAPAGSGIRLALLAASSACALSVLTLLPRRSHGSTAGRRSLDAYLLHGFLVRAAVAAGVFSWLGGAMPEAAALFLVVGCGWAIAATLSTRVIDRMARPLLCPVDWLLERWPSISWGALSHRLRALGHFY